MVRAGLLADSDMVVRRLGIMEEVTCASPAYLAEHGIPVSPDQLDGHTMIGFVSFRTDRTLPLEFMVHGRTIEVTLLARVLVGSAATGQ